MSKTATNTNVQVNSIASATIAYDNSITASASATVGNKNANLTTGVSAKTGTQAGASAGLDGKNVYANVSYSDTTEVHATIDNKVNYNGVGGSSGIDAYAKTGTELSANMSVGSKGVDVGANASTGTYVGVDATGTVNLRGVSGTAGAGVTAGDHFAVGGSGKATFDKGKATVGVSGDVAALIGIEVDASVTVDTKQVPCSAKLKPLGVLSF
jgi:hypothetical protein